MIEPKRGSLYMAFIVLLFAIPSNLLQYWAAGPGFGGMSGVVFGLIGYMWIYNRYSYRNSYPLDQRTINFALGWLVICTLGWVGPIANWAHAGGLVAGMIWGYLRSDRFMRAIKL
jgi:GlpG protein